MTNHAGKKTREELLAGRQLRLTPALEGRLKSMQEAEQKRQLYPIALSHVLRKCIALGLDAWEQAQRVSR